jgi:homoserine kinase
MTALRATVRVPGIARADAEHPVVTPIDLWLTLSAICGDALDRREEPSVVIERAGTLERLDVEPGEDRLARAFFGACAAAGRRLPTALHLRVTSQIPVSVGLGASTAAIVAGAVAANALLDLGLDDAALARVCTTIDDDAMAVGAALSGSYVVQLRTECEPSIPLARTDIENERLL